jgi:hypothetical protein
VSLSVVIPSKTWNNLRSCLIALERCEPNARVIVVDDGLSTLPAPALGRMMISTLAGMRPFIFARNCNLGIRAAGADDVVLLNDDALLESRSGFTDMQAAAAVRPEIGIVSATTNLAGNPEQWPAPGLVRLRTSSRHVAFVCVLLPRRTIETVGLLDERFTAYGWEDNDYCRRVRNAGLRVGIFDGCYVDHGSLTSSFRGGPRGVRDCTPGSRIYQAKWGDLT